MNDHELILYIGEIMVKEKVITDVGVRFLHNDFLSDITTLEKNELKKMTRCCIYLTILFNMTVLYGGYCQENNLSMEHFERLRQIVCEFEPVLPKLLNSLSNKYLEVFHGAKVASFVHGRVFDDYLPNHPEDQKILEEIKYQPDEPIVLNV
jgi:hypothetical protein